MSIQNTTDGHNYIKCGCKRKIHYETNIPYIIYNKRRVYITDIIRLVEPIIINEVLHICTDEVYTTSNVLTGYIYEGAWVQTYVEVVDFETVQLWKEREV